MSTATISLREKYEQLKAEQPKMRIRDAAKSLGASEGQLVASGVGINAVRLEGNWQELLPEVISLGKVMALTRNDDAVHERKGIYDNITFQGPVGTAVNEDIDLRMFMMHWASAYAVTENDRKSIQFFDKAGDAVHKIYCTEDTDIAAYEALVAKYTAAEQTSELAVTVYPAKPAEKADTDIDVEGFKEAWKGITDSHQFFGLLGKFGVTRLQAMRMAPEGFVQKVPNDIARKALDAAAERQVPIMIFVGNRGCIQIHTGNVEKVMEAGPWYNVIDPDFNLHLRETSIAHSFIVKKPSEDGTITSLEIYDAAGELIVQFFGKRKPGIPELETWRTLVTDIAVN